MVKLIKFISILFVSYVCFFFQTANSNEKIKYTLKLRDFGKAREFARSLGLSTRSEWDTWCNKNSKTKPKDIPVLPNIAYKGRGWISYKDWLIG